MSKIDVLSKISEEQKEVLRIQEEKAKGAFDTVGLSDEQIRENFNNSMIFWNEGASEMYEIQEIKVSYKNREILTRIFYPTKNVNRENIIFYIHGGGFSCGNLDTHGRIMKEVAFNSNNIVIGIDYSLAPENRYPTQILECANVYKYFIENQEKYGLDIKKSAFMGDSAGANISLGTTLFMRDNNYNISSLKKLMLFYGIYGMEDSVTRTLYGGPWDGLTKEDTLYYTRLYIGDKKIEEAKYFDIFSNDLKTNMPEIFLAGAEFDPLLDDSRTLFEILKENKIPCEFNIYSGTLHVFLQYGRVMEQTRKAIIDAGKFFNK